MKIIIPGKPIAKARPKFARRGKYVTTYNPQETEEGKWLLTARGQITEKITAGPISLHATFRMARPKGHYGTGKNSGKLKASAPYHHTKKPDLDNLIKFVKDCLNGEAWHDDSQVVTITARKYYGDEPETELRIVGGAQ